MNSFIAAVSGDVDMQASVNRSHSRKGAGDLVNQVAIPSSA